MIELKNCVALTTPSGELYKLMDIEEYDAKIIEQVKSLLSEYTYEGTNGVRYMANVSFEHLSEELDELMR